MKSAPTLAAYLTKRISSAILAWITLLAPVAGSEQVGHSSTPALSVSVRGNHLVDATGQVVQLRGVNFSGFESVAIQGWSPADPSGGQAGQPGGPRWSAITAWKANAVRLPLNEASWLGATCIDTDGKAHDADPGKNYRQAVEQQVQQANTAGLYVVLDLHWAAPGTACPMLQTQMADRDHSLEFWKSVAGQFKGNPAVLFELYNEPYFDGKSRLDSAWKLLIKGGSVSFYPATSSAGTYRTVDKSWAIAGMQEMLDVIRKAGARNVVVVCGIAYCNDMSGWLANPVVDPLGQVAAGWHPYPPVKMLSSATVTDAGSGYAVGDKIRLPRNSSAYVPAGVVVTAVGIRGELKSVSIEEAGAYLETQLPIAPIVQASSTGHGAGASFRPAFVNKSSNWSVPSNWPVVQAISARFPVIITETAEHNEAGTDGAPFLQQLLPFADANGWSVLGFTWDVWKNPDNVLIDDVDGHPTDGYGSVFREWMVHAHSREK